MITYEVKINGQTIKRIDARRIRARSENLDVIGYDYEVNIYDYENQSFTKGIVKHKYQDGFGKLLEVIIKELTK